MISYIEGDIFKSVPDRVRAGTLVIMPHVVNNAGQWGAGFTGSLSKYDPNTEKEYRDWFAGTYTSDIPKRPVLGNTLFVFSVVPGITSGIDGFVVANMVAQVKPRSRSRPLDYIALAGCMNEVSLHARRGAGGGAEIHCPLFGCGLAGGDWWDGVEPMVQSIWDGLPVTVYAWGHEGMRILQRKSKP